MAQSMSVLGTSNQDLDWTAGKQSKSFSQMRIHSTLYVGMSALVNPTSEVIAFVVCILVGIHSYFSAVSKEHIKYFS